MDQCLSCIHFGVAQIVEDGKGLGWIDGREMDMIDAGVSR